MRPRLSSLRTLTGQKTRTLSGTVSPRDLNHRCRPSETTASTASLTVQPNRSFNALNADRGIFRPRPVRCAPILRLKKRSVLGVTILPLTFTRLLQGKRQVRQTTGSLVRSDRSDAWRFQRMGLISCQFDGPGRGCQPFAGGSAG